MAQCFRIAMSCLLAGVAIACDEAAVPAPPPATQPAAVVASATRPASPPIVAAARSQIGRTVSYDGAYVQLGYPGGDVPIETGVCTDVVIRSLRDARRVDLQQLVHEDMRAHFPQYPPNWGLRKPDRNIDHRRVPNLAKYFTRQGWSVPITREKGDYLPGDLVTCTVPPALPHIMVVSDRTNAQGVPLILHNIGRGTREEDRLFEFKITGHFRLPPERRGE